MRSFWCLHCRGRLLRRSLLIVISVSILFWFTLFLLQEIQENAQSESVQSKHVPVSYERQVKVNQELNGQNIDNDQGKKPPRTLMGTKGAKQKTINKDNHLNASNPLKLTSPNETEVQSVVSKHNSDIEVAHLDLIPSQNGPDSLQLLQRTLLKKNQDQRILNEEKFPPLTNDGLVLVIQVHKREGYLKQLLQSLKAAREIENVLLVISHDHYYDDMNAVVESIDFCKVIQIFYPFSLQLFPDTFPGSSKNDCPRDATKEMNEVIFLDGRPTLGLAVQMFEGQTKPTHITSLMAVKMNCTNANCPDSFGHYREAKVTAIKHHWWWKINMVFDNLRATANFSGYVLFLEEDHYVAPDFVVMANQLIELKKTRCPECDFVNLGMYNKVKNYHGISIKASVGVWNAGKNNMGFGMDRQTWNTIKGCAKHFCSYDDYNWDWSLNALGSACLERHLKVMVLKAPRILHIGTCGTHHHKSCNEEQQARLAKEKLNSQSAHLFPSGLFLDPGMNPPSPKKKIKPYGGWGDTRDHELCLHFLTS